MGKRLGDIHALHLANEDLCGSGDGHPGHLSDFRRRLSDNLKAVANAEQLVEDGGIGHTASLYIDPKRTDRYDQFVHAMKACRVVVKRIVFRTLSNSSPFRK